MKLDYGMSNLAILSLIGQRIKEYRIRRNLQQKELARHAGISQDTVVRLEQGFPVSTEKLVRILRSLEMLENIDLLVPEPPISPILMKKLQGKQRMRIRHKKNEED